MPEALGLSIGMNNSVAASLGRAPVTRRAALPLLGRPYLRLRRGVYDCSPLGVGGSFLLVGNTDSGQCSRLLLGARFPRP